MSSSSWASPSKYGVPALSFPACIASSGRYGWEVGMELGLGRHTGKALIWYWEAEDCIRVNTLVRHIIYYTYGATGSTNQHCRAFILDKTFYEQRFALIIADNLDKVSVHPQYTFLPCHHRTGKYKHQEVAQFLHFRDKCSLQLPTFACIPGIQEPFRSMYSSEILIIYVATTFIGHIWCPLRLVIQQDLVRSPAIQL